MFSYCVTVVVEEGIDGGFCRVGVDGVLVENDTGAVGVVGDVTLDGLFHDVLRDFVRLF